MLLSASSHITHAHVQQLFDEEEQEEEDDEGSRSRMSLTNPNPAVLPPKVAPAPPSSLETGTLSAPSSATVTLLPHTCDYQ
jgi:hypothetical protein